MKAGYEVLDHPADVGIEARGNTLAEAFEQAARGLVELSFGRMRARASAVRTISLSASDQPQLLVRWLSEILYLCDAQGFIPSKISIGSMNGKSLRATLHGGPISASRPKLVIKAVTYHQLAITSAPKGATVRVFFDV